MNNNNYTVIHSKDPWLLARLSTDLMMEGIEDRRNWNELLYHLGIWDGFCIEFGPEQGFTFRSSDNPLLSGICHTLTESNYLQVLTTIIERHGK